MPWLRFRARPSRGCPSCPPRATTVTCAPPSARSSAIARPILRARAGDDGDAAVQFSRAHARAHLRSTAPPLAIGRDGLARASSARSRGQPPKCGVVVELRRGSPRGVSGSCAPPRICGFADLAHAAVLQRGADMAGEIARILVVRIDHVGHFRGERAQAGSFTRSSVNCSKPALPSMKPTAMQ